MRAEINESREIVRDDEDMVLLTGKAGTTKRPSEAP